MQEAQNIFDDPVFFDSYMELRSEENFNDLLEQPAMGALLPPLEGRRVLDIGCGFGRNCMDFVQRGASEVLGIDISSKMLNIAMKENPAPEIEYRRLAMEDLSTLEGGFDLIYSSLAFHYALDFPRLMRDCHDLLVDGGILLFSQAATVRALLPLGISLGISPAVLIALFPAVNGYFFIPNYPTVVAAINFDRTGTTRIGKYVLNHSFMMPGLIATGVSVGLGLLLVQLM